MRGLGAALLMMLPALVVAQDAPPPPNKGDISWVMTSTVLVIRGNELLTGDTVVGGDDVLEVRPVMSGGSAGTP